MDYEYWIERKGRNVYPLSYHGGWAGMNGRCKRLILEIFLEIFCLSFKPRIVLVIGVTKQQMGFSFFFFLVFSFFFSFFSFFFSLFLYGLSFALNMYWWRVPLPSKIQKKIEVEEREKLLNTERNWTGYGGWTWGLAFIWRWVDSELRRDEGWNPMSWVFISVNCTFVVVAEWKFT